MAALPRVPSSSVSNLKYEPLDPSSKRPSIRIAILQPGSAGSTVKVTLAHAAFVDRPRYEALSYTWGPANKVKGIEVNRTRINIRENLWYALVSLRDARQERGLWIDAICINQEDIVERNSQVKLMAHIFERAEEVIVWLGRLEAGPPNADASNLAPKGENQEIFDLCRQPYWRRVWIVQEVGAATKLRVHWTIVTGKYIAVSDSSRCSLSWDEFVRRIRSSPANVDMALKLAEQRERRHGDSFLLANLMEVCQDSLCEEPRDKIYGFVGIAHDCQDDSLSVDYSKSLFDLYEDVIRFQYHWAKETHQALKANKKTIIHFSQLVQRVLGGPAMYRDFATAHPGYTRIFSSPIKGVSHNFDPFKLPNISSGTVSIASADGGNSDNFDVLKVTGVHSGTITIVGPGYSEIIGDPTATKSWKATLPKSHANLEHLRKKNEGFMRVLLKLNRQDLAKVRQIETEFWWKKEVDAPKKDLSKADQNDFMKLPRFKLARSQLAASNVAPRVEEAINEPRLFLCRNGVMGLMPPNARSGDLIFQFWNSDASVVVRLEENYMMIVGRAVISNKIYQEGTQFHVPLDAPQYPSEVMDVLDAFDFAVDGRDIYMDISTLQVLTQ